MLPDMDSGEDMLRDAHSVTEWLGIRNVLVRDITPVLRVLGTYELFGDLYGYLGRNGSNALASGSGRCPARATGPAGALSSSPTVEGRRRVESRSLLVEFEDPLSHGDAVRASQLHNLLVLGTTNRSEYLTGWFTKYGDGAVDLEVILPLYKTRMSELAVKLDVPGDPGEDSQR